MKLTSEQAEQVIYNDSMDWQQVPGTECIVDHSRWAYTKQAVFQHIPTEKFYRFTWERGATESQEQDPFYGEVEPEEVVEKEVLCKVWTRI